MNKLDHTFVVCAYKESNYLEECIKSLENQTVKSKIVIASSTPNSFIKKIAKKHNLEVVENNPERRGIGIDFDFSVSTAKSKFMTVCHQDDIYDKNYLEEVSKNFSKNPIIIFTNYNELREGKVIDTNQLLKVKRLMLLPMKIKLFESSKFIRRRILSLGCPICCPSVTFNKEFVKTPLFDAPYKSDIDWQAWEKLSRKKGKFCYVVKPVMQHRVHEESETSNVINSTGRKEEDLKMFQKFWPTWIAKIIVKFYSKSEESNQIKTDKL